MNSVAREAAGERASAVASSAAAFWTAAEARQLAIQQCSQCRCFHHPPVSRCYRCDSTFLDFAVVSGHGTIYAWTHLSKRPEPSGPPAGPVRVVQVELQEQAGLFLYGNMPTTRAEDLKVSAPVRVIFIERENGSCVPDFVVQPAGDA